MKKSTNATTRLLRLTATLLLLAGTLAGIAGGANAQSDQPGLISDTEYESPVFDFTLSWSDPWILTEDSVTSDGESVDQISLETDNAFLQIVLVTGSGLQDAMDILLKSTADSGDDYEELGTDSGTGYQSATAHFSITSQGEKLDLYKYIEVGELETHGGDSAIFTASLLSTVDSFDAEWASLLESVDRDGRSPLFSGEPTFDGGSNTKTGDNNSTNPSTQKAGIDGNTYLGANYGFSVEWDDSIWEAEDTGDGDADALILSSDNAQLQVRSYSAPDATVKSCVTDSANEIKGNDGIEEFARTTDYTSPDRPDDAYSRIYTFNYVSDTKTAVFVQYIECRPLEGGDFVLISLLALDGVYEDELPNYADVIDTLTFGGGATDDSSIGTKIGKQGQDDNSSSFTPGDPKLKGSTYTGGAYDYSVTWDKAVWTAEAMTPDNGYEGVKLTADASSAWVEAIDAYEGDAEVCVTDTGDQLNEFDGVSNVAKERRPTLPETGKDAVAAIYSYTYTSGNDSLEFVEYIDCRVLVEGSTVLRVTIIATLDSYESQVPDWEAMLAGIAIGSSGQSGTTDNNTNTTSNNTSNADMPGVDGREYTSPSFPFSMSWDRTWEAVSATADDSGTTVTLASDISTVVILVGEFPVDPADCVDTFAGITGDADGVSNFRIVTNDAGEPQSGGDDASAFALYSFTQGGDDYFDYLYCQPSPGGDYVVAIAYQMPVASLATEIPVLEELLANFELG